MSSLYDMISAFIAMLMSAAFLHFGAAGDSRTITPVAQVSPPAASPPAKSDAVVDDADRPDADNESVAPVKPARHQARHAAARHHARVVSGGVGVMDTMRALSPLRHG